MKPKMNINIRISIDDCHTQRYTEEEIFNEFLINNINIENRLIIRKNDGAVMGELLDTVNHKDELVSELNSFSKGLDDAIIEINTGILKDDIGSLDVVTDPMQTKSFSRGRVIGLVIARDRIQKLLKLC